MHDYKPRQSRGTFRGLCILAFLALLCFIPAFNDWVTSITQP